MRTGEATEQRWNPGLGVVYHMGDYGGGYIWPRIAEISGQNDLIKAITAPRTLYHAGKGAGNSGTTVGTKNAPKRGGIWKGKYTMTMKINPSLDPKRLPYWMTTKQVAAWLGMDETVIRYRALKGVLPGHKMGSLWRFSRNELMECMQSGHAPRGVPD